MGLVYPESFTYRTVTSACNKCFWSNVCVDKSNTKNYNHISKKLLKLKWKKKNKCHYLKIDAPSVWITDIRQDPCFDIYDIFYPCHPKITATIETHQMRQHFSSLQFSKFSCSFYTKFWPYYPLLQQKPRVIRLGNIFTIFHCPLLVSPCKQWTLYSFVIRQEW